MGPIRPGQQVDTAWCWAQARVTRVAGRPRGPLDPSTIAPGELVQHVGHRNQPRVTRESCSNTLAFEHGPELGGTVGRPRGPSDPGPSAWNIWLTSRALRPTAKSPRTAGQHNRTSDSDWSCPEWLVNTAGPWAQAQIAPESWSTLQGIGPGPESPGRAGRCPGPSNPSTSGLEELLEPAPSQTRDQVGWDGWSTRGTSDPGPSWMG